jgi:hypothetical protein
MADIKGYPLIRHLRGNPTMHVRHLRRGKAAHDGTGLSFFFRPLSAVLSEVPVDDRELPLLFHTRTADFQDLAVQASVTFRLTDPAVAGTRIDFSVDPAPVRRGGAARPGWSVRAPSSCHLRRKRGWRGSSARPGRRRRAEPPSPRGPCRPARR